VAIQRCLIFDLSPLSAGDRAKKKQRNKNFPLDDGLEKSLKYKEAIVQYAVRPPPPSSCFVSCSNTVIAAMCASAIGCTAGGTIY